jgi:arabinofuranosyltransferase
MNLPNENAESPRRTPATLAWCVFAVLLIAVSWFAYSTRDCFVDDAFIGFQYIKNLMAGHGFVFHVGQKPVEGVTNIGWLLLLAPLSAIVQPTVAAKGVGLALLLTTLAMTMLLGRRLAAKMPHPEDGFGLTIVPAILLASNFEFVYFPLAGMETALLAAILLLMTCLALRRSHGIALPLLGAFAFLVHPEAVAVYPLYAAVLWIRERENRRRLIVGNVVLFVCVAAITATRYAYFGDVVPNTFHAKPGGLQLAVQNGYGFLMGRNTNLAFPVTGWLAIPVLLLGWRRLRRASPAAADMLAVVCGVGVMFAVYSPEDWTTLPRYFAPYLPESLLLLWAGIVEAAELFCRSAMIAMSKAVLSMIALLLVLTNGFDVRNKMSQAETFPGYVLASRNLIGPAEWMRDNLPADATIATRRIGVLAYYSRQNVFDYTYGLTEPDVARLVSRRGQRFDTPTDPALEAVWRDRAPKYLLEDGIIMSCIISHANAANERFTIHGVEYRVLRAFPIGTETNWVLAERCK